MEILVYEHLTGGGFAKAELPVWGLPEGYAMLKALIEDFKRLGCKVSTTLDWRIPSREIQADQVQPVKQNDRLEEKLVKLASKVDAAIIVAPEQGGTLLKLIELVEKVCPLTMNCPSAFLKTYQGKAEILEALRLRGVKIPETITLNSFEEVRGLRLPGFPSIVKPSKAAGCQGLSLVEDGSKLAEALKHAFREAGFPVLVQRFIDGQHASLSLLAWNGKVEALSLNLQLISLKPPPEGGNYLGGLTPLSKPPSRNFKEILRSLAELKPGLRGYVGVDLILTGGEAWVVEVNPRLTTSYLGLRRTLNVNPASLMLQAAQGKPLTLKPKNHGFSVYLKVRRLPERLPQGFEAYTPPLGGSLLVGWARTLKELFSKLERLGETAHVVPRLRCGWSQH